MTPPRTDQYQRALDLLDEDNFWNRYIDQIQAGAIPERENPDIEPSVHQCGVEQDFVPAQLDGEPAVTVLHDPNRSGERQTATRRTTRSTWFQRTAIAAAAGISIVAGVSVLTADTDQEPIEVTTETDPTATVEVPVVVAAESPEPAATAMPNPDPTVAPEPLTTPDSDPDPEATPEAPANEPEPESPAITDDGASGDNGSSGVDAETAEEPEPSSEPGRVDEVDASSPVGEVLGVINRGRSAQGLPPVQYSPALSNVAHQQAWSLTDYQDAYLARQPDFSEETLLVDQARPLRESAWFDANLLGGIDIGGQLPAGWNDWQHYTGRGTIGLASFSAEARELHVGDFTHVGIAAAEGRFANTAVLVFARYPTEGPTEPAIAVRTDGRCFAQVADPNRSDNVRVPSDIPIQTAAWPGAMDRVEVKLCGGVVSDPAPQTTTDSRYSVSLVRRSDQRVLGSFTCFAWDTCDAVVDLDGASAPFDIVLNKLGSNDLEVKLGQVQTTFYSSDGQIYRLVAGN